jgi:hypothetical protein
MMKLGQHYNNFRLQGRGFSLENNSPSGGPEDTPWLTGTEGPLPWPLEASCGAHMLDPVYIITPCLFTTHWSIILLSGGDMPSETKSIFFAPCV